MAPVSFYAGSGDPSALQRGYAFQTADGVPVAIADMIPFKCYGGAIAPSPKWIERLALIRRPMREKPMTSKVQMEGLAFSMGDLDPNNHMTIAGLLSFFQGYDTTTANGHTRWRISQQQAVDGTEFLKKMTFVNDSNKGIAIRIVDLMVGGFTLGIQPNQNAKLDFRVAVGRYDFWPDAVVTGTGVVKPILRHALSEQFDASATTGDVVIEIQGDTATEVTFTAKLGGGAESAVQTATKGVWTYVYLGASDPMSPLGNQAQQIQVYFPTGIDGTFVNADVWTFQSRHALDFADEDYPTPMPLSETQFRFYLGGEEIIVNNGVTITADAPGLETLYSASGEQPVRSFRAGQHNITIALDRRLVDMTLQQKLMQRGVASLVVESRNDIVVGTSAYRHGVAFVFPECVVEGAMHDTEEGGTNYDEQLTLRPGKPATDFDLAAAVPAGGQYTGITDIGADCEVIIDSPLTPALVGAA